MSVEAARLHVTVTSDTDSARRGLFGLGNDVDHTSSRFGSAVGGMAALGAGAFVAIGAAAVGAGVALVKGFSSAVTASSDLSETLNKANVVFGQSAKGVIDFGESAARSFGMSKNEAIGAAATFGNLFKTIGIGQEPAANMSKKLVTLASDLASFNNMDPTEVLEKLRSGLSGEVEPLRSMGVFLNEATVKAKAMEMGLADTSGELSEAAKVQARYALILEQTSTAQGDFANTSKGLANQQRILKGQWGDLKAAIGDQLRPALEGASLSLTSKLMPALQSLAPVIGGLAKPFAYLVSEVVDRLAQWLGQAGRVEEVTAKVAAAMSRMGDGIRAFFTGVQGADTGGLLDTFRNLWESIGPLVGALTELGSVIVTKLGPELPGLINAFADLAVALTPAFVLLVEALTVAINALPAPVVAAGVGMFLFKDSIIAVTGALRVLMASGLLTTLGTAFSAIARFAGIAGLGSIAGTIGTVVTSVVQLGVGLHAVYSVFQQAGGVFQRFATISVGLNAVLHGQGITFAQMSQQIQGALGGVGASMGWVTGIISGAVNAWAGIVQGMQATVVGIITGTVTTIIGVFSGLPGAVAGILSGAVGAWSGIFQSFHATGTGIFSGAVNTWVGIMQGLPGAILGALGDFGSLLVNAGRALIGGLINGIQSRIGELTNVVSQLADLIARVKGPLPKDRKLLIPAGQAIMGGLMRGISSQVPALASQLGGLTGAIPAMAVPAVARGGGGGSVVHINVDARGAQQGVGDEIARAIDRRMAAHMGHLVSRVRSGVR